MKRIRCSGIIFIDKENRVLLEDRRKICKHGEHWSFFGGVIEKGESIKQALNREVKEELGYNLKDYKFFKRYDFSVGDLNLTYFMYVADIPSFNLLKPHKKADMKKFTIKQAMRLRMANIDKRILSDLQKYLRKAKI